jgi:serine O-acetyltransferase
MMKLIVLVELLYSDLFRITSEVSLFKLINQLIIGESFKYIFWLRICSYLHNKPFLYKIVRFFAQFILRHYKYKYGISISYKTKIGKGLYIGHFGNIVISSQTVIGNNCNISHGVTIGVANRGPYKGIPIIGNNVYIGPGAKIFGNIKIGNNVAIGANCVVNKNIPDNAVVAGVPGVIISYKGSVDYVTNTEYELNKPFFPFQRKRIQC